MVRTSGFHPDNRGSIPLGDGKRLAFVSLFFCLNGIDFLEIVGGAEVFLLLRSPTALFEVGFQLTFLACLGIALLKRPVKGLIDGGAGWIRKVFPKKLTEEQRVALAQGDSLPPTLGEKVFQSISSVLSASIAAQIATAPVLMYAFGFLSGWSLLLNFFFVPVIGCVFSALLLCVVLACLLPATVASALLYLPQLLWTVALLVFELMDFSKFALTGIRLTGWSMFCYYAGCTFLSDKWNVPKGVRRVYASLCFLIFTATVWIANG